MKVHAQKVTRQTRSLCAWVCVSAQGLGGRQDPRSGWREGDKGGKVGEESLTVSVTDSCQENESAVCQPTTCTHTHTKKKRTRIQSGRPWGRQSTQCLVKGREDEVGRGAPLRDVSICLSLILLTSLIPYQLTVQPECVNI